MWFSQLLEHIQLLPPKHPFLRLVLKLAGVRQHGAQRQPGPLTSAVCDCVGPAGTPGLEKGTQTEHGPDLLLFNPASVC